MNIHSTKATLINKKGGHMKVSLKFIFLALSCSIYLILTGCSKSPTEPEVNMVNSGSWYETPYKWPHDGNPYESENFVIYSDAASLEARQFLAEIGEDVFAVLKEKMGITDDSIFRFPAGRNKKIHIYAYKNHYPTQWGGQAYMGGFIIYSLDHPQRTAFGHTEPEIYTSVVKHELVHVIQSLIIGRVDNRLVDVWFSEGIAEAISESTLYTRVDSQAKLDELTSTFGMLNPIAMHLYDYPDIESVESLYYYPMFRLAVDYLTDPNGHGRTYHDIRDLLLDVADGMSFKASFRNSFGMSLNEYESQFFDLMNDYLD